MNKWLNLLQKKNVENDTEVTDGGESESSTDTEVIVDQSAEVMEAEESGSSNTKRKVNNNTENEKFCNRKRKYNESFLQYGFTYVVKHDQHRPLCLICEECFASESMKPGKLKRHLAKHSSHASKPLPFFERLLKSSTQKKK